MVLIVDGLRTRLQKTHDVSTRSLKYAKAHIVEDRRRTEYPRATEGLNPLSRPHRPSAHRRGGAQRPGRPGSSLCRATTSSGDLARRCTGGSRPRTSSRRSGRARRSSWASVAAWRTCIPVRARNEMAVGSLHRWLRATAIVQPMTRNATQFGTTSARSQLAMP